jgi:hypothetical protein
MHFGASSPSTQCGHPNGDCSAVKNDLESFQGGGFGGEVVFTGIRRWVLVEERFLRSGLVLRF